VQKSVPIPLRATAFAQFVAKMQSAIAVVEKPRLNPLDCAPFFPHAMARSGLEPPAAEIGGSSFSNGAFPASQSPIMALCPGARGRDWKHPSGLLSTTFQTNSRLAFLHSENTRLN
jgi:hypothetical protein